MIQDKKLNFFLFPHKVIKEKDEIIYNLNQVVNDEKNKFNKYILEKDIKFKNNLTNFSFVLSEERQLDDFSIKFFTQVLIFFLKEYIYSLQVVLILIFTKIKFF